MKLVVYILIAGLFFLHPRHVLALDTRQGSQFAGSFQKMQKENKTVSDNSQNPSSYFDDDLSDKDDDDINHTARKKFSFGGNSFSLIPFSISSCVFYNSRSAVFYPADFFHLPPSHFVSLKVFRL